MKKDKMGISVVKNLNGSLTLSTWVKGQLIKHVYYDYDMDTAKELFEKKVHDDYPEI